MSDCKGCSSVAVHDQLRGDAAHPHAIANLRLEIAKRLVEVIILMIFPFAQRQINERCS
jgi:hypothetical protein